MVVQQQEAILVTVDRCPNGGFEAWAVFVLSPEACAPAEIGRFPSEERARAHAQAHWSRERHLTPVEFGREVMSRRPRARRR